MRETFDHVIVGAGSAGCTLANRLSADVGSRVLLLEAGSWDRDPLIHIPLGWGKILQNRLHDWMYFFEPEEGFGGRSVECARGKVVGGSSSINAMAHVRGNRDDYDTWAASGLHGWSYGHMLPYFRRQEHWEGGADGYRGTGGPLNVQFCRYRDPLVEAFGEAGREAGFPWTPDYNGRSQDGIGRLQMTIHRGRRCSAASAYLRPALRRRGLAVAVGAHATRILFEGSKAVGVEFRQGSRTRSVRAEREVIVSCGAINSPQLLMLSGIGDARSLHGRDIPVHVDLPGVGGNLQDHVSTILLYRRKEPGPFFRAMRYDRIAWSMMEAWLFGTGFASDVPGGITAFLKSDPSLRAPDIQLLFTAAPLGAGPWFRPFIRPFVDGFACRVVMLHPQSSGHVVLAGDDPGKPVRISSNFLSTEADRKVMHCGVELARDVASQPSLQPFIDAEIAPGAGDIDAHVRSTAITVHHPLGTCSMGVEGDPGAVLDDELRVLGTEGLRVVDASVMPRLISGNINAAVVAVAERACDLILGREPLPADAGHTGPAPAVLDRTVTN